MLGHRPFINWLLVEGTVDYYWKMEIADDTSDLDADGEE